MLTLRGSGQTYFDVWRTGHESSIRLACETRRGTGGFEDKVSEANNDRMEERCIAVHKDGKCRRALIFSARVCVCVGGGVGDLPLWFRHPAKTRCFL